MGKHDRFGVLLTEQAYQDLGEALKPYIQHGPIGKYIYAKSVENQGNFVLMTILPEQVQNKIGNIMTIWIPTPFVKFIVGSENLDSLGFSRGCPLHC